MSLVAIVGALSLARAADVVSIRSCSDVPKAKSAPWAVARTVRIDTGDGTGTGVVVSPDGIILTAAHVVAGQSTVTVVFPDKSKAEGNVVRRSKKADLAMVRVEKPRLACIPVEADPAEVGSDVLVVGSPGGAALSGSVVKGIVSAYREVNGTTVVQTDASINPGNSGGPMVDEKGKLIGIVSYKITGPGLEGLGFAVAATNIPAELSIRWGTETASDLAEIIETEAAATSAASLSRLELPDGVRVEPGLRYETKYRPGTGGLVIGGALLAGGLVLLQQGSSQYGPTGDALENVGLTTAALGGLRLGFSFLFPSKTAPVVSVPEESE